MAIDISAAVKRGSARLNHGCYRSIAGTPLRNLPAISRDADGDV